MIIISTLDGKQNFKHDILFYHSQMILISVSTMLSGGIFTLITFMMMKNFDKFYAVSKKHRISVRKFIFNSKT